MVSTHNNKPSQPTVLSTDQYYQGRRRCVAASRPRRRGAGTAREGAAPWPHGRAPRRGARRWSGSSPPTGTWRNCTGQQQGMDGDAGASESRMGEGGIGRNRKQSRPVPDAELEGVGPARSGGRGSKNGNPVTMRRSWRRRSLARSRSMPDLRRKLSPPSSKKGCRAEAAAGAEEPAQREAAAAWSEKTNLSPGLSER